MTDNYTYPEGFFNPLHDPAYYHPLTHWVRIEYVGHIMAAAQEDIQSSASPNRAALSRGLVPVHEHCQRLLKLVVHNGMERLEFVQLGAVQALFNRLVHVRGPMLGLASESVEQVERVLDVASKRVADSPLGADGREGVIPVAIAAKGAEDRPVTTGCLIDERVGELVSLDICRGILATAFIGSETPVNAAGVFGAAYELMKKASLPSSDLDAQLPVPTIVDKISDEILVPAHTLPIIVSNVVVAAAHGVGVKAPATVADTVIANLKDAFEAIASQAGVPDGRRQEWLSYWIQVAARTAHANTAGETNDTKH